jgi:hypothetical protein
MKILDYEMLEDQDIAGHHQCVLKFGDDYRLSIVAGRIALGNAQSPYEIAVLQHGNFCEMPGITQQGDVIKGYLTEDDVAVVIKKMYTITAKEPVQV